MGTSSVEYGLILAMVALVAFFAIQGLAGETITMWNDVSQKSSTAMSGS
jgi:Flp/Fap pilin component.